MTFWTWRVLECIPLEVSGNDGYWYTECEAPTTFARLLINVLLLAAVSGAAFALQRAGRLLLRYHSRQ